MTLRTMIVSTIVLATTAVACTSTDLGPDDEPQTVATAESELYAAPNAYWPRDSGGVARVPVCWVTSGYATEKGWVRNTIETEWASISTVKFSGWGDCNTSTPATAIRIRVNDVRPSSDVGPTQNNPSMNLNFTWSSWYPTYSGTSTTACPADRKEFCIRFYALHEFGHALGFRHEQDAPGSTCTTGVDANERDDGVVLSAYDGSSIMNYCAAWGTTLSTNDRAGLKVAYACTAGKTFCGNTCRALQTDEANCGRCGTTCASAQQCSSGRCVGPLCASGKLYCATTKTCVTPAMYPRVCR